MLQVGGEVGGCDLGHLIRHIWTIIVAIAKVITTIITTAVVVVIVVAIPYVPPIIDAMPFQGQLVRLVRVVSLAAQRCSSGGSPQ